MPRRILTLTAAALFVFTASCGVDDSSIAADAPTTTGKDSEGTTDESNADETKDDGAGDRDSTDSDHFDGVGRPVDDGADDEGDENDDITDDDGGDDENDVNYDSDGDGSNPKFCRTAAELDVLFDAVSPEDFGGYADVIENAGPMFEAYIDGLPGELTQAGERIVQFMRELGELMAPLADDPEAEIKVEAAIERILTPEVAAAGEATDSYEEQTCGAD